MVKASELIQQLVALMAEHGDLVVSVKDEGGVGYEIETLPAFVDVQDDSFFMMDIY